MEKPVQDIVLFKKAIAIEIEKRAAILTADGRTLQQKTRESVELLREMRSLGAPLEGEARDLAERLRTESNENMRLLEGANRTLHNLFTGLGEREATYSPAPAQKKSGGFLLDATV